MDETRDFFDEMAPHYDADLPSLGWDPVALVRAWPFVAPPSTRVLDAGCGTGAVLEHYAGAARTLAGFDLAPEMVRIARRRRALRDADLRVASAADDWPYEDGAFDRVVAIAMLEFVERLDSALDELSRVLAPGGRALVSVEDLRDAGGTERERQELRYGRFPLWRRTFDDLDVCIPPELEIVCAERVRAYTVIERGFACAYHVVELARN